MNLLEVARLYALDLRNRVLRLEISHSHIASKCDPNCMILWKIDELKAKLEMIQNAIRNSEPPSENKPLDI